MPRVESMRPRTLYPRHASDFGVSSKNTLSYPQPPRHSSAPTMHLHRSIQDIEQARALNDTVTLAIMGAMSRPVGISPRRRPAEHLGASTLSSNNLREHLEHFEHDPNYDQEILRQGIGQKVPYFLKPLGAIPVKAVEAPNAPNNPLVITLESLDLQEEMDEISAIVGGLRGTKRELHSSPHITVARFPGIDTIPPAIIEAVEEAIPKSINLGVGEFYAHD